MTNEITPADVLEVARAIIEDPKHWGVGYEHRGERFCSIGAISEARWRLAGRRYDQASLSALRGASVLLEEAAGLEVGVGFASVIDVNDGHLRQLPKTRKARHKRVINMFDRAIRKARYGI